MKVGAVLEGTVRRAGKKLRVSSQLTNARTGLVMWSESFERDAKDVFAVQDDITKAMAKIDAEKAQANSAKLSAAISIGTSILGAFLGRKSGLGAVGSLMKGSNVTSASRVMREGQEAAAAEAELASLQQDMAELNKTVESRSSGLARRWNGKSPATSV